MTHQPWMPPCGDCGPLSDNVLLGDGDPRSGDAPPPEMIPREGKRAQDKTEGGRAGRFRSSRLGEGVREKTERIPASMIR